MDRQKFSTDNPWEESVGFSRLVRVGNLLFSAGTIAVNKDGIVQGGTCYEQTCYIFEMLSRKLEEAGSSLKDVVRVVSYLVDLSDAADFSRAHREYFGEIRPATTCIGISELFGDGAVVEIELTAIVPD